MSRWVGLLRSGSAAVRPLLWLGEDQAFSPQDPPDRRYRRCWRPVRQLSREVVGDRVRASIVAFLLQLLAQSEDRLHDLCGRLVFARAWSSRTGLQGLVAPGLVASDQLVDPTLR